MSVQEKSYNQHSVDQKFWSIMSSIIDWEIKKSMTNDKAGCNSSVKHEQHILSTDTRRLDFGYHSTVIK